MTASKVKKRRALLSENVGPKMSDRGACLFPVGFITFGEETFREREEDSSLFDVVKGRGVAKQDQSSILRRWARLFPFTFGDSLWLLHRR